MDFLQAIILGVVEGLTEFLPVSSTGHLRIVEDMMGLDINSASVTGFTAVIQVGAIAAVILYFRTDIVTIARAWFRGVARKEARDDFEYRMGWYVIVGTLPIAVLGFLGRHIITGTLSNLWVIAGALILWSAVIIAAEMVAQQNRHEQDVKMKDAILIGVVQCVALIPGVSRSGATISAGLFAGLDRVAATRLSFLLSIPAITGAGLYGLKDSVHGGIGWQYTLVATIASFVVAYATIAWLLRFVAHHPITWFVAYRVALGLVLVTLLATGVISAT